MSLERLIEESLTSLQITQTSYQVNYNQCWVAESVSTLANEYVPVRYASPLFATDNDEKALHSSTSPACTEKCGKSASQLEEIEGHLFLNLVSDRWVLQVMVKYS